jgi:hypothetical protein
MRPSSANVRFDRLVLPPGKLRRERPARNRHNRMAANARRAESYFTPVRRRALRKPGKPETLPGMRSFSMEAFMRQLAVSFAKERAR